MASESLNPTVVAWFEKGLFREGLLGEGGCYLADHTDRSSHAFMLVMRVFLEWATVERNRESAEVALAEVMAGAVKDAPGQCADALLAYSLHADEVSPRVPLEWLKILEKLRSDEHVPGPQLDATERKLRMLKA